MKTEECHVMHTVGEQQCINTITRGIYKKELVRAGSPSLLDITEICSVSCEILLPPTSPYCHALVHWRDASRSIRQ